MKKIKYFILTKSVGFYINSLSYLNPKKASLLAYRLFSEPRIGKLKKNELPLVLQDAKTETFTLNGNQFESYYWQGNQNIILLVHGWESNASRWEKLLPYLKKTGSTIVAIDAPAHGLSAGKEFNVPTYASFIDVAVQKFQPNFLIGHSLGGATCVYYQHKYQNDKLEKMVLLGAPSDLKTLIGNYKNLLSLNSKMEQLLENHFIEKFNFKFDDFSAQIFGQNIKLEGIIAHDIDDTVVAFAEGKKIAGSWKNATFIETKGLGHSMHDDELYQKITHFLVGA